MCLFATITLQAQVSKTVNCTAGALSTLLTVTEQNTVTNLTLTGTIDARDFKTMRDNMPVLAVIDMGAATIAVYTGTAGTNKTNTTYGANTIPDFAFSRPDLPLYFRYLYNISLPTTITSIGVEAFSHCSSLSTITIPAKVNSIGKAAFFDCGNLMYVYIPASVKSIGSSAFGRCFSLNMIKSAPITPVKFTESFGVFQDVDFNTCKLYVPVGRRTIYKTATQWKDFAFIEELEGLPVQSNTVNSCKIFVANNVLRIYGVSNPKSVATVYGLSGQTIATMVLQPGTNTLHLNGVSAGVYVVQLNNGISTETTKIVLN